MRRVSKGIVAFAAGAADSMLIAVKRTKQHTHEDLESAVSKE